MEDILKNKKIVILCGVLILVSIILYFTSNNSNKNINFSEGNSVNYLKNYGANEYTLIYVEEADVVIKYFNDFINSMIGDVNVSYNLLNKEYRDVKFGSVDKYKKYVNDFIGTSIYSLDVDVYKVIRTNGYKFFDIYDTNGNHYIFKENSIMNYEVYLDNYTVDIK